MSFQTMSLLRHLIYYCRVIWENCLYQENSEFRYLVCARESSQLQERPFWTSFIVLGMQCLQYGLFKALELLQISCC